MVKVRCKGGPYWRLDDWSCGPAQAMSIWELMGTVRLSCPRCGHRKYNIANLGAPAEDAIMLSCCRCEQLQVIGESTIELIRKSEAANDNGRVWRNGSPT